MAEKTFPGESGGKRVLTDETLRDLYENKGITMKKIAEQFGISFSRVQQRLAKMAVGKRKIHPLIDPESLRHMYCELRLTQAEIARKFDVTPRKVGYELAKYGIRLLRSSASQALLLSRETVVQAQLRLLRGQSINKQDAPNGPIDRQLVHEDAPIAANKPVFTIDPTKPYAHPYYWAPFILIGNWK